MKAKSYGVILSLGWKTSEFFKNSEVLCPDFESFCHTNQHASESPQRLVFFSLSTDNCLLHFLLGHRQRILKQPQPFIHFRFAHRKRRRDADHAPAAGKHQQAALVAELHDAIR